MKIDSYLYLLYYYSNCNCIIFHYMIVKYVDISQSKRLIISRRKVVRDRRNIEINR